MNVDKIQLKQTFEDYRSHLNDFFKRKNNDLIKRNNNNIGQMVNSEIKSTKTSIHSMITNQKFSLIEKHLLKRQSKF